VIAELTASAAETLIADGTVTGGMIAKVRGALDAAQRAGVPVVIASWGDPAALEALATGAAIGTRVLPSASVTYATSATFATTNNTSITPATLAALTGANHS
jgi:glutamate 5-kinase